MTKITSMDLTPFYRNTIGMDRLFDRVIDQVGAASSNGNYPPYNIVRSNEDSYEIHLAVAGFHEGELEVEYCEGRLTITGQQSHENRKGYEYLHHGISSRDFSRSFALADYVEVCDAVVENGILIVSLERVVPETMKPKTIAITHKK